MIVGIIGLGLIGGSMAKAFKRHEECRVLAYDIDQTILDFAKMNGDIDGLLDDDNVINCDLLLVTVYPQAAAQFLEEKAPLFDSQTIVVDCLGVKREICRLGFELAEKYGFTYIGGHPMAGTHNSGYKYANEELFDDQPMVIVAKPGEKPETLTYVKELLQPAGFGSFSFTTPEEHDRLIAFTSQLAHVVSNAYIKSPTAEKHAGFSAGSYQDLTRIAWLKADMWSELFLANAENLSFEIESLIDRLTEYKEAIDAGDRNRLVKLLKEGCRRKREIDGR